MKLRSCNENDLIQIEQAVEHLKVARKLLGQAGADKARAYVAASIKSAEGAHRHCLRIVVRGAVR